MGRTLLGGTKRQGNVQLLNPQQQQLFSSTLGQIGPQFQQAFGSFLQEQSPEQLQDIFQQSYVQPAQKVFEQQFLPAIQQRFVDANAGSSSALNQALAQAAGDLSTSLGAQYGQFFQNQRNQQLQAVNQFLPLMTGQTFSPVFQQQQGILGPLIQGGGQAAAAYLMSSEKVKENIKDYPKSLETIHMMNVKQYDYKEEAGGQKDRVGLIAEEIPKELTAEIDGIKHVDLYGLIGILINSVKELSQKVQKLEALNG
jgi:hypothetical protein